MNETKFEELVKKIQELKKAEKFDLSMDEDLSIAIMNLISLEEHFFYTAEKTGKDSYLDLLNETRTIRKELLGKMIPQHEVETWCISKHLLAGTMRIMEVGTKLLGAGKKEEAKQMFHNAYKVYSLFWALRLKLIDLSGVKKVPDDKLGKGDKGDGTWSYQDIVNRLVNCCDE